MNLKKSSKSCRHILAAVASVTAIALLTGCGGTPEAYIGKSVGAGHSQTSGTSNQPTYYGTGNQPDLSSYPAASAGSLASSFTLNSTENFKGFNSEIWNDDKSWYECNCGNNQPKSPKTMPWNTAG
jgi:hypothetical protein